MPSYIYALLDPPVTQGSQVPSIPAWKLEIEGTIEETLQKNASLFPMGETIITVTDTKATAYSTAPQLTEVKGK